MGAYILSWTTAAKAENGKGLRDLFGRFVWVVCVRKNKDFQEF